MSRRWRGESEGDNQEPGIVEGYEHDLAAKYARDLSKMHEDAQHEQDFCSRVLGYKLGSNEAKGVFQLPLSESRSSAAIPRERLQSISTTTIGRHFPPQTPADIEMPTSSGISQFSPRTHIGTPSPTFTSSRPVYRQPSMSRGYSNVPFERFPQNDELTAITHTLLGNEFLELDRIITLDGTDFSMNIGNGWQAYEGEAQVYE